MRVMHAANGSIAAKGALFGTRLLKITGEEAEFLYRALKSQNTEEPWVLELIAKIKKQLPPAIPVKLT